VVLLFPAKFEEFSSAKMWLEVEVNRNDGVEDEDEEKDEDEHEDEDEEEEERKEEEHEEGEKEEQEMEPTGGGTIGVREESAKPVNPGRGARSLRTLAPFSVTHMETRRQALQRAENIVSRSMMCTEPIKGEEGPSDEEDEEEEEEEGEDYKLLSNHASVLTVEDGALDDAEEEDDEVHKN
jgi:hypothetical protein